MSERRSIVRVMQPSADPEATTATKSRWAAAVNDAREVPEDQLLALPLDVLLGNIVRKNIADPVVIQFDQRIVDVHESRSGGDDPLVPPPMKMTVEYPATGNVRSLRAPESGSIGAAQFVRYHFDVPDDITAEHFKHDLAGIDKILAERVREANIELAAHRADLIDTVRPVLETRWRRTRRMRDALHEAGIPLRSIADNQFSIPLTPKPFSMDAIELGAAAGADEWVLENELAEGLLSTIAAFSNALERLPSTANRLLGSDEESLRDVLLFALNAGYRGQVTGETFISRGKADILFRWNDRDAFVGECKIWKGPKALSEGVDQLLTRYTLWRQSRIALVLFVRDARKASEFIEKACVTIAKHPRTLAVLPASEPHRRSDYTVASSGDARRPATLTLLPVVIPTPS